LLSCSLALSCFLALLLSCSLALLLPCSLALLLSCSLQVRYCESEVDCRRKLLVEHFTSSFRESFDQSDCNRTCDTCLRSDNDVKKLDLTGAVEDWMQVRHLTT
jgi:hypothetical protein